MCCNLTDMRLSGWIQLMAILVCFDGMVMAKVSTKSPGFIKVKNRRMRRDLCEGDNNPLHCPMEDTQHLCTVGSPGQTYPRYLHLGECSRWNPGNSRRVRHSPFNCKACCNVETGIFTLPKCIDLHRTGFETCNCGVSKYELMPRGMVVGGNDTKPNEFPWQVSLLYNGWHICGGSLLSNSTVLTAAHCKKNRTLSKFTVVFGEHDRRVDEMEVRVRIASWTNHPNYSPANHWDNDFAILKLEHPIQFNEDILPICLPAETNYENRDALVTGWGRTALNASSSNILQKADIRTITNTACTSGTGHSVTDISRNMICVTGDGKGSCKGDSGGAIVTKKRNKYYYEQIGVVSWGRGCATAPGVTARVTSALDWIIENMEGRTCPPP